MDVASKMIRISNADYCHFLGQANLLRQAGSMCDAVISVKGQKFKAHRLVLACASRTLAQQLVCGDSDPSLCTIDYISSRTFEQVLDFTYSQSVEVSTGDLRLLLRAAHHLEMPQLLEQCRDNLDPLRRTEEDQRKVSSTLMEAKDENHENPGQEDTFKLSGTKASGNIFPSCSVRKPELSQDVITPVSNSSYFTPPWTFSPNMWSSVTTLRQIAQNYSSLVTGCPLPTPSMSPVVYPVTFSSPRMLPLLSSCFRSSAHHTDCSSFGTLHNPDPHSATVMGRALNQRSREKPNQRALTRAVQNNELREKPQPSMRVIECLRCRAVSPSSGATFPGGGLAQCGFCKNTERRQKGPKSHQQDFRGEKPHRCQHCPKTFSLKHQLDTHHRVHTGEKPFECRLCGQRSRDYSAMIKHLRTHGGASPYQCTACLEFCSSLVAMRRHVKSHAIQDFPPDWNINSTYLYKLHN